METYYYKAFAPFDAFRRRMSLFLDDFLPYAVLDDPEYRDIRTVMMDEYNRVGAPYGSNLAGMCVYMRERSESERSNRV